MKKSKITRMPEPKQKPLAPAPGAAPAAPAAQQVLAFSGPEVNVIYRALMSYQCSGEELIATGWLLAKLRSLQRKPSEQPAPAPAPAPTPPEPAPVPPAPPS